MIERTLHQSEVKMYLKCGLQWEFRYERGIIVPPSAALTVGRAADTAINHNLSQKIDSGVDVSESEVVDACATAFEKEAAETEWKSDEDPGEEKDAAIECVKAYHSQIAPKVQPETVQEKFVLQTDAGYNLGGTMDIVDKNGKVRDSKTSKEKYKPSAVFRAIQPAMYDFAYEALRGKPSSGFAFDVMVKPRVLKTKYVPAETQIIESKVTEDDRAWLFKTIERVHRGIRAGVAIPADENSWVCSEKWCGYWSMCKGKK